MKLYSVNIYVSNNSSVEYVTGRFLRTSYIKTAGWVTHKLENNYTTEVRPLEWRF